MKKYLRNNDDFYSLHHSKWMEPMTNTCTYVCTYSYVSTLNSIYCNHCERVWMDGSKSNPEYFRSWAEKPLPYCKTSDEKFYRNDMINAL